MHDFGYGIWEKVGNLNRLVCGFIMQHRGRPYHCALEGNPQQFLGSVMKSIASVIWAIFRSWRVEYDCSEGLSLQVVELTRSEKQSELHVCRKN